MTIVNTAPRMGDVPNQPKTPVYGFRYPRKDQIEALIERWGGKGAGIDLTAVGMFAMDEFLAAHGDAPNPPPGLLPREEDSGDE